MTFSGTLRGCNNLCSQEMGQSILETCCNVLCMYVCCYLPLVYCKTSQVSGRCRLILFFFCCCYFSDSEQFSVIKLMRIVTLHCDTLKLYNHNLHVLRVNRAVAVQMQDEVYTHGLTQKDMASVIMYIFRILILSCIFSKGNALNACSY